MVATTSSGETSFIAQVHRNGRAFIQKALQRSPSQIDLNQDHPTWDSKTAFAINTIRTLNSMTAETPVNLQRIRRVRSYITLPTHLNVRIQKTHISRRSSLVLEHMTPNQATGTIKGEWVEYLDEPQSFFGPNLPQSQYQPNTDGMVVLYLHGGGYALCSRKTHRGLTWKVAKHTKSPVLAIDYRLAPEHVFPLALHDAISAYSFLTRTRSASKVTIVGDSAGGGLALALALWLRDSGADYGLSLPAGVALMSPWLDLSHSLPSFKHNGKYDLLREKVVDTSIISDTRSHFYISDNSFLTNPLVSPLFAQEIPEKQMCPILIQVGDSERLRDESIVFAMNRFSQSTIQLEIYEGMVHVFQMLSSFIKVADVAMERLGNFAVESVAAASENGVSIERSIKWIDNDIKNDFPARLMTNEEVDMLLETANGQIAEEVSSVLDFGAEATRESEDDPEAAQLLIDFRNSSSDSAVSDVEFSEGPFVPLPNVNR
ncbi:Alpha/Beta hydrolase protein [Obelidium mucronatum]|nr:Alpha/Beta hydrolase protein [Obelidium mucronatum]